MARIRFVCSVSRTLSPALLGFSDGLIASQLGGIISLLMKQSLLSICCI